MPLLNYTTSVPATRTIAQVQRMLAEAGAEAVTATYHAGSVTGLSFVIAGPLGARSYVLPVKPWAVERVLAGQRVPARYQTAEHAYRVAWRILKDWLEAQLAIVATEMAELDQVMLPYMTDDTGRTVYELYRQHAGAPPALLEGPTTP